jgi:endonuclease YncB( thermonuclease family)
MRSLHQTFLGAAMLVALAAPVVAESAPLPFLHDDYANALAQAKQRHLPVFVEVWAPW